MNRFQAFIVLLKRSVYLDKRWNRVPSSNDLFSGADSMRARTNAQAQSMEIGAYLLKLL
jgi:hypothetical protein